jgi:hypothetical protein
VRREEKVTRYLVGMERKSCQIVMVGGIRSSSNKIKESDRRTQTGPDTDQLVDAKTLTHRWTHR